MTKKTPPAITYMEVKEKIDAKRKALGIEVSIRDYDKNLSKPTSDSFYKKNQRLDYCNQLYSVTKPQSIYQSRLDKAFEMYLSSNCTREPDEIATELGISHMSFRSELVKANCTRPIRSCGKARSNQKLTVGRSKYLFQPV